MDHIDWAKIASASNVALRKCASCGAALSASNALSSAQAERVGDDSCDVCRTTRFRLFRTPPPENCPRCNSTRVLRTRAITYRGDEMFFCSHCDHIWSSGASGDAQEKPASRT